MNEAYYSPVCSLETLRTLGERHALDPYQLLLAHQVLEEPEEWFSVVDTYPTSTTFVIMDNSLIELGEPMDIKTVETAAIKVAPSLTRCCVVLPDVLGEMEETVQLAYEGLQQKFTLIPAMGVVQGRNLAEMLFCIRAFRRLGVTYVAVPRIAQTTLGTRERLVLEAVRWFPGRVHLLGCSSDIVDDIRCVSIKGVMGIDSAAPVVAAWHELKFPTSDEDLRVRPPELLKASPSNTELLVNNVQNMRKLVHGQRDVAGWSV